MLNKSPDRSRAHRQLILNIFGDLSFANILVAILILVLLDLTINYVVQILDRLWVLSSFAELVTPMIQLGICFVLLVVVISIIKRTINRKVDSLFSVNDKSGLIRADTIVMFLSKQSETSVLTAAQLQHSENTSQLLSWLTDQSSRNPWRMNYEGILEHIQITNEAPVRVVIIPSKESADQVPLFKNIFRKVFAEKIRIYTVQEISPEQPNIVDYNQVDDVYHALKSVLNKEIASKRRVAFDITSGTKPLSIAGGIVSTGKDNSCTQYVTVTGDSEYKVKIWSANYENAYEPHE